jgi:hypothetical protein
MKLDNTNITFGSTGITLRKQAIETNPFHKKTISDTYAEHAKLVFLFDVSGSMASPIARSVSGKAYSDLYIWSPEVLADIRNRVGTTLNEINIKRQTIADWSMWDATEEERELSKLKDHQMGPSGEFIFSNNGDDEDLKDRILRADLTGYLGIAMDLSKKPIKPPTRMDIVKKLAKQEIMNRVKKFPKSRIAVVPFGDQPITLFDDGNPAQLETELDKLTEHGMTVTHADGTHSYAGGGTDILKAIRSGMEICRNKPSAVGIHHFILVTDGEDYNASATIPTWVQPMKTSGVVLDYIHIGDSCVNDGLKQACQALGGDYISVNSEIELEEKFVQAMNRPLLPPPASAA